MALEIGLDLTKRATLASTTHSNFKIFLSFVNANYDEDGRERGREGVSGSLKINSSL